MVINYFKYNQLGIGCQWNTLFSDSMDNIIDYSYNSGLLTCLFLNVSITTHVSTIILIVNNRWKSISELFNECHR